MNRFQEMTAFVSVVKNESFSKAADELFVVRSAISSRVNSLEDRLGVQLLIRTTRKINLTEDGERFYESCINILNMLNEAEQETINQHGNLTGTIRISAPLTFGINYLSPILNEFLNLHSGISLNFDLNDRTVNILEEKIDLVIRIGKLSDSTLMSRSLSSSPRVIAASPAYLELNGEPDSPDDLSRHMGINYSYASKTQHWQFQSKDGKWISVTVPSRFQANNGDVLLQAAINGLGILNLPSFMCADAINKKLLIPILTDYKLEHDTIYVLYPQQSHLPKRIRMLIDFLIKKFKDVNY
ncbi:MAG: LysR family transcriptional regulator [Gammaproteobacteria bacterium]|nr:LysR family transcriptional regulator [Gammaproteobacteria bacterium]